MRLPRWLLVSLIAVSAVALLAVPAWLWVEMPRRTAMEFIAALESGDNGGSSHLMAEGKYQLSLGPNGSLVVILDGFGWSASEYKIELVDRSVSDLLVGRQELIVDDPKMRLIQFKFVASFGGVRCDEQPTVTMDALRPVPMSRVPISVP